MHRSLHLRPVRRPLTAAEQRLLRARIRDLQARSRRARTVSLPLVGAVVLLLWAWTLLASDAPRLVITGFWLVVGGAIALWVRRDLGGLGQQFAATAAQLESGLRRNEAEVYEIHAQAFAELEEIEDEGACYVFELQGEQLVVITGQEFAPTARFPSLDFDLVDILDEQANPVEMLINSAGPRATPARTITPQVKRTLRTPEHLEVLDGTLADLEARLAQ